MGTIPTHIIEQIAAANDIVEVIGSLFSAQARRRELSRRSARFIRRRRRRSTSTRQRQTFHCFGCGVGGSVFRFVMDYEHIDFPAAVRKLAARAGIPVIEERGGSERGRSPA